MSRSKIKFRLFSQKSSRQNNLAGGRGVQYSGIIGNISRSLRALTGSGIYGKALPYAVDLQFIKTYICKSQTHKLHLFLQSN
jgi:hypothetical protein